MNYYRYSISIPSHESEMLLAWLSELPFEAFEETEEGIRAYLPGSVDPESLEQELAPLAARIPFSWKRELLPSENWNAVWESNFSPVQVGAFCGIRAEFHPAFTEVRHELVIQPKMAFGTGHHETTYMMVALMENLDFSKKKVLDFGCGTGILAILAARMGAASVDAVDIEPAAVENSLENALRNGVKDLLNIYLGELDAVPPAPYGIILANINRNVILEAFPALHEKLDRGGTLLISGILNTDREMVFTAAIAQGFQIITYSERGDWIAARLLRP